MNARPDDPLALLVAEYLRTRDTAVRDEIVLAAIDLVEHIAQRYRFAAEPVEDLIQEGTIGLINAVEMFDGSRGVKFTTYASHAVQGAIQHYLRDKGKLIREPGWLHDLNQKIGKARGRLNHTLGREPSSAELAADLQMPEQQVSDALATRGVFRVSSLEQPQGDEGDGTYSVVEHDAARVELPENAETPVVDRLAIEEALGRLRAMERQVVLDFFFNDLSKTEIARRLGYSSSHVAHLLRRALKQLKDALIVDERNLVRRQLRSLEGQLADYARRVEEETIRDDLTGLYNRRYLLDRLDEELSRCQRYGFLLSVVLVDLDGFEAYLGEHGRAEADQALMAVARLLTAASRRIDRICRYDERRFLLLLPNTGQQSTVLCERLVAAVDALELGPGAADAGRIRAVCGIAVYPLAGADADALIAAANDAVVRGRASGQGVVISGA
ncbi:MAG: sigma-70 family RNA polymerase sigma factor [Armatimonadetes bacterium]|nr:sigma-70 family RNA polymerase sigma factor [Armatimonadota bacterium]